MFDNFEQYVKDRCIERILKVHCLNPDPKIRAILQSSYERLDITTLRRIADSVDAGVKSKWDFFHDLPEDAKRSFLNVK